ncbi:MAG: amphi-Trp domain-containing protein [Proteobacteria bacterium]|nr:amphi-Trp domain-containing protein [Pseudomonadota bacterium]
MEKDKIELKTIMETADVADYLTALANGFRAGRIVVEKDGEHLVLNPAAMSKAEVEIEARIKKDKAKFSLELSWMLAAEEEDCGCFKIGTELSETAKNDYKKLGDKKPEDKKVDAKSPEEKKPEVKKPEVKQAEEKKADDKKPAPHAATPAPVQAKSDVKPTAAPASHEPGGKAVAAAQAQAKPKA